MNHTPPPNDDNLGEHTAELPPPKPIPDGLLCEAADQGFYTQLLLIEINERGRTQNWNAVWEHATVALQRGFDNGLVMGLDDGKIGLTELGEKVLADARRIRRPMETYAIKLAVAKLTQQAQESGAEQAEGARAVSVLNDALDRILAGP